MNSFKKTIALACAASILGLGVAVAQTAPATPDAGAAPAAGDTAAPAPAEAPAKKPMKSMKPMKKTAKAAAHNKPAKKAM